MREPRAHGFDSASNEIPHHAAAGEEHSCFVVQPSDVAYVKKGENGGGSREAREAEWQLIGTAARLSFCKPSALD